MNIMELIGMMRRGNPMQTLMGASKSNPIIGQVMQMTNGRTPAEMRQMVQSIAQQRGVDISQLAQRMGLRLPF